MATTAIFPLRVGKGRSVAKALKVTIDYMEDSIKTGMGEYISSYKCTPGTADLEFALSKQQYLSITGRYQGDKDVIAYHVRQSFAPGEITPEEANRLGYELAQRFTRGCHAFIVCTHVDKAHIHNHVVWNSTTLECTKKFRNFIGSAFALRRCSDILCAENGLSVVKDPQPSRGKDYAKHVYSKNRPLSYQDQIRLAIDDALSKKPATFEDFVALVEGAGITAKRRGKHMRFMLPGQKQPTRLETLGGNHTEEAIRERIAGRMVVAVPMSQPHATSAIPTRKPSLLIDIQSKIREGKGAGYARWASAQNLKLMAKTLIYLQECGLDDFDALKEKSAIASARFNELSEHLKVLDAKLTANADLQKHIVTYSKTRAVYTEYRKAGYSKAFRSAHEADIVLQQAAKKAFDEFGYGKDKRLPTVASLRAEYTPMLDEKKRAYREYRQARAEMQELVTAKSNIERFLNIGERSLGRESERAAR
ncbi:MAG: relaxase/mobilization nuclease domain-containing protein [Defluviitaleaceae bacterium]|nr:relaxase/mobilization nuclease domain-containing protein [Defluviitaleaceae bacterium]